MNFKISKKDIFISLVIGILVTILFFLMLKILKADQILSNKIVSIIKIKIPLFFFLIFLIPTLSLCLFVFSFLLGQIKPAFEQFGKFALVGMLNTFVDWGALNLLLFATNFSFVTGFGYSLIKGISFIVATINSYYWNKFWTFKATQKKKDPAEFLQFLAVSIVGFVINVLVATVVVNLVKRPVNISPTIWATIGAMIATIFGMLWNFFGYKIFVFKK